MALRAREKEQAERERHAESLLLEERLTELDASLLASMEDLRSEMSDRLESLVADDLELRRLLAGLGGRIGEAWAEATGTAEEGMLADARPVLAEERRQALRRAMRARRDEAGESS